MCFKADVCITSATSQKPWKDCWLFIGQLPLKHLQIGTLKNT